MAKRLYVHGTTEGAKATDEVWLSGTSGESIHPQTASGLTYGWITNASGVTVIDTSSVAGGIYPFTTVIPAGTTQGIRISGLTPGAYTLKAIGMVPSGGFAATRLRWLDSDGTTVLWTQPVVNVVGAAADYQINTDGSLVSYDAADAGITRTITGTQLDLEIVTGAWNARYSYFEIAPASTGNPGALLQFMRDQARMAGIHSY